MRRIYGTGNAARNLCFRCGRGGARCFHKFGGRVHKSCMSPDERRDYNKQLRDEYNNAGHNMELSRADRRRP